MIRSWNRLLWGIEHYSRPNPRSDLDGEPRLIGGTWHRLNVQQFLCQPSRPILFTTKKLAQAWCKEQHEFYKKYKGDGICEFWRFRPVRVRETVSVVT